MFDPSVPKRLKPHHIATIFNQKMYEALVWRMQQDNRFSSESEYGVVEGTDIRQWDIVIGQPFPNGEDAEFAETIRFGVVIGVSFSPTSNHNHIVIADLRAAQPLSLGIECGDWMSIYFDKNDTYRTVRVDELNDFWKALEAYHA